MTFKYVCKFTNDGWRCDEELTPLRETGIYESDIYLWDRAKLSIDNDRDSYNRIKDGDPKAFKEEFLKHYHLVQQTELERWKEDETFLKVYGKIGGQK